MSFVNLHSPIALVLILSSFLWSPGLKAKTSGTHQNTVRKEVVYSVAGDIREARITFMDSTGRVEHEIVHVPWKLKVMMPCKRKISLAARNLSPNGNIVARITIDGTLVKEITGEGHLAGVFAETLTCS